MRYYLFLMLLLLTSCSDEIGTLYDFSDKNQELPSYSCKVILLPDTVDPVSKALLNTQWGEVDMKKEGEFFVGEVNSSSYLGHYSYSITVMRGDEVQKLNYNAYYQSSALALLCSPTWGTIKNYVKNSYSPTQYNGPVENATSSLTFDSTGIVQNNTTGESGRWFWTTDKPMKALWGDTLEDLYWWNSDTLYRLRREHLPNGERALYAYDYFTNISQDTLEAKLSLSLESLYPGSIEASWQKESWPSYTSKLTLYISADGILDTTTAIRFDVSSTVENKLQIHNLQSGFTYRGKLIARKTDGSLIAESAIVKCNLDKGIPQSFELYGLALTSNSITFRLPDLSFPDFKSLTLAYTTGYITPTDSTKWDTTVTITDSGTEEFTITDLTAGTEYTFAAYLLDSLGNEVLSKPYLIRLPEATE